MTVSHHVLGPVGVSKSYRAHHLSVLPRPRLPPSTLPDPIFCSIHPSPTTPPNARPLKTADRRRSAHQVVQQVEVTRTLTRTSRLMTAPLGLTTPVYSLVSAS